MSPAPTLDHHRQGRGAPLVLLHGLGQRWGVWEPVLPALAEDFDVVAVSLPGFGTSPPLAADDGPTAPRLAAVVTAFVEQLGVARPHVAGISLGGFVALEMAAAGTARSVLGISPAGLWGPAGPPARSRRILDLLRATSLRIAPRADALARRPATRTALGLVNYGRPWLVPVPAFAADVRAVTAPGWQPARDALDRHRFAGGPALGGTPVTIAWGTRDQILPRGSADPGLLPRSTRWVSLPGCGHTPTWDDPGLIAAVVREACR